MFIKELYNIYYHCSEIIAHLLIDYNINEINIHIKSKKCVKKSNFNTL